MGCLLTLRGDCCNLLRILLKQLFCPINCTKHFYVIISTSFTHLLWGEIWGCRLGMGVIKENCRGGWWNPMTFILSISKIFDEIYASNFICRWESSFPYIFTLDSCENPMFLRSFSENHIFANFYVIFSMHPNFLERADFITSQWRHMKFNGTHFGINR